MLSQPVSYNDGELDDTTLKSTDAHERFIQLAYCLRESVNDLPDDHSFVQPRQLEDFEHQALSLLKGVDVLASPERGHLVLECAVDTYSRAIVEAVLDKGVDINAVDHEGRTALHKAVLKKSTEIIELLLVRGVHVNVKDRYGKAAIHDAARAKNPEIAVLLLETNQSIKKRQEFDCARQELHKNEKAEGIYIDVSVQDDEGLTPLHIAILKDNNNLAKLLMSHGSNVNLKTKDGHTPLHIAVGLGNWEIASLLLSQGARVNDKKENGYTALHFAVLFEFDRVEQSGSRETNQDSDKGFKDMVELLLKYGADLNAQCEKGTTPLHLAVGFQLDKYKWETIIREAVEYMNQDRSDTSSECSISSDAYEDAQWDHVMSSIDYEPPEHISPFDHKEKIALIEILLGKKADLYNIREDNGHSVIELALMLGYEDIVKRMLEEREDVNYSDDKGRTVLMLAAMTRESYYGLVEAELNAGADLSKKDNEGLTALHHACSGNIVDLLLNRGANINEQSNDGSTPLHCALRKASKNSRSERATLTTLDTLFIASNRFDIRDNSGKTVMDYFNELQASANINGLIKLYQEADIMKHITSSINDIPTSTNKYSLIDTIFFNEPTDEYFKRKWFGDAICSHDILNHTYILGNLTFTVTDECATWMKDFNNFWLNYPEYRTFVRGRLEQAKRMPAFLDKVSEMFANALSDILNFNIPTEISHIILLRLTPVDLVNLNTALQ